MAYSSTFLVPQLEVSRPLSTSLLTPKTMYEKSGPVGQPQFKKQPRLGRNLFLIQRAVELTCIRTRDRFLIEQSHEQISAVLCQHSLDSILAPTSSWSPSNTRFGCISCGKQFKSAAGEGAHMFKVHQQVAPERRLFHGTQCHICLHEFHSADRLHKHVKHSTRCRAQMEQSGVRFEPSYGIGSSEATRLRAAHDGLRPSCTAAGPLPQPGLSRSTTPPEFVDVKLAFFENLLESNEQLIDEDEILLRLRVRLRKFVLSWSQCCRIVHQLCDEFSEVDSASTGIAMPQLHSICESMMDHTTWGFFLDCVEEQAEDPKCLETWEDRFRQGDRVRSHHRHPKPLVVSAFYCTLTLVAVDVVMWSSSWSAFL